MHGTKVYVFTEMQTKAIGTFMVKEQIQISRKCLWSSRLGCGCGLAVPRDGKRASDCGSLGAMNQGRQSDVVPCWRTRRKGTSSPMLQQRMNAVKAAEGWIIRAWIVSVERKSENHDWDQTLVTLTLWVRAACWSDEHDLQAGPWRQNSKPKNQKGKTIGNRMIPFGEHVAWRMFEHSR